MRSRHAHPNGGSTIYSLHDCNAQGQSGVPDGELLTDEDLRREPVKEPSRRWRNKWRAISGDGFYLWETGEFVRPGSVFIGPNVWGSREIAEAMADRVMRRYPRDSIYLGPVESD